MNNYDFSQNLSLDWRHNDPNVESDAIGDRYVSLEKDKFIEQSVITSPLTKYRVTIEARSGGMNTTQSHIDVEMPGHRQLIMLEADNFIKWGTSYLFFTAQSENSFVKVSTSGKFSRIQVRSIAVEAMRCSVDSTEDAIHVHIHHTSAGRSSITASWIVNDLQSPVVEHKWAVGYVAGKIGEKLLNLCYSLYGST